MSDSIKQGVIGNYNTQVAGDLVKNIIYQNPIRFKESDLKTLIDMFSDAFEDINHDDSLLGSDFKYPGIEKKNELNELSPRYFKFMNRNSVNYFKKIDVFLGNTRNSKLREKYYECANEINNIVFCHRDDFDKYEKVFASIYNYFVEKYDEKIQFDKNLVWVFMHYMYYNCELGEKYD